MFLELVHLNIQKLVQIKPYFLETMQLNSSLQIIVSLRVCMTPQAAGGCAEAHDDSVHEMTTCVSLAPSVG